MNTDSYYAKEGAAGSMQSGAANLMDGKESGLTLAQARSWALDAGFTEAGVVELPYAATERDAEWFEKWIDAGNAGSMHYLERRDEAGRLVRARVETPFPWARSAIVCFANYQNAQPFSTHPVEPGMGWIARYAWTGKKRADGGQRPSDYHKVLKKRLEALEARVRMHCGAMEARGYVDTGPVVERSLARAAGLGWTGKNSCLIHPKLGSFGFLAVLLTSLPVREEGAHATMMVPDRCGTCRRCIEACPTDALAVPYRMEATKCISYLTIEHKGLIADELMAETGRQVFGCDICQDVCPWNRKAPIAADEELETRTELVNPALEWLAAMDEAEFEKRFNGSPVRRAGFWGLRRNIAVAMGNSGVRRFVPVLEEWAEAANEGLRAAAQWALGRLQNGKVNNGP